MSREDKVCRDIMIAIIIFFMVSISCVTLRLIVEKDMVATKDYIDVGSVLSVHGDTVAIDVKGEVYEFLW